jgi:hypothetical protein
MAGMASFGRFASVNLGGRLGLKMALGALAAGVLAWGAQPAHAAYIYIYIYSNIVNPGEMAFNQELGINNSGEIAGYFSAAGWCMAQLRRCKVIAPPQGFTRRRSDVDRRPTMSRGERLFPNECSRGNDLHVMRPVCRA